jgi:hypothetical protein
MDPIKQRSEVRAVLLDNGFIPLPLAGKACFLPGWSHLPIDAALLKKHARNGAWSNTGIRCGNVVGIDIDCDDPTLCGAVKALVTARLGPTQWVRLGREPRQLWLYWNDSPIAKLRSNRHGGQQLEILGKGCQFAAYGVHPTTGLRYQWTGDMQPFTHGDGDLPDVSAEQLRALVDDVNGLLAATGLPLESPGGALWETPQNDYCLTGDMAFMTREHGLKTVDELRRELPPRGHKGWVCHLTAIRASSDSWGGLAGRDHQGNVCVADFVTGVTYFETLSIAADEAAQLAQLLDQAQAAAAASDTPPVFEPTPAWWGENLKKHFVYVMADDTVRSLTSPAYGTRKANFSNGHRIWMPGRPRRLLVDWWLEHDALKVHHAALLPDAEERIVTIGEQKVLNTYVPPEFPVSGGDTALFHDFVRGLIWDAKEQALLLDWMAYKVQHVDARMHCLVLVAEQMGTGRGTLMKILEQLLGSAYTTHTTLSHVFGRTYQSQYNDWLTNALLVTVPEAHDNAEGNDWAGRRKAYESLKEMVETSSGEVLIRRKGMNNTTARIFASICVSTNHVDALAIEEGDRRLLVLSGGEIRGTPFYAALYAWLADRSNVGALWRELRARKVAYDPMGAPPMTAAKTRMLMASKSDLDTAFEMFREEAPGDVFTLAQYKAWLRHCEHGLGMDLPEKYQDMAERMLRRRAWRVVPTVTRWTLQQRTTNGGRVRFRPWILRNPESWQYGSSDLVPIEKVVAEARKNGDPMQKVTALDGPPWDLGQGFPPR